MLSDAQNRWLAEQSYWVDERKDNKPYIPEKEEQYYYNSNNPKLGKFEVLKTENNEKNGMQAMAVAPVDKNGKVDTTEIVIAYAGTNFADAKDRATDLQTVILGDKMFEQSPAHPYTGSKIDGQVMTAQKFANEIKAKYPDAKISTTGHSLGEFLALTVSAENQWRNVGFNGPNPSNILSEKAKKWVEENPGMLTNYRNRADLIGNFGGDDISVAITVSMEMGTHLNPVDYHQLSNWTFDKEGKLKIPNNDYNQKAILQQAERYLMMEYTAKLSGLLALHKKFQMSGRGISSNEQIYLDDSHALAIIETAVAEFKISTALVIKIYQDGMAYAEKIWNETLQEARKCGDLLTESEILEELECVGCTEKRLVIEPCKDYQNKINKVKKMGDSFDRLAADIKNSIEALKQKDRDLALQLA